MPKKKKKIHQSSLEFLSIVITSKTVYRHNADCSLIKITLKKIHQNDAVFFLIKLRRNNVYFSSIKMTLNNEHQNNVDLLPIKFTSKECIEITCKFVDILFLTYWPNIDIELRSTQCIAYAGFTFVFLIIDILA